MQIFLTAFALILTAYFTRLSGFSPYAGVCICLAVFIVINFVILLAQRSFLKQDIIAASKINSLSIFLKTQLFAKMGLALAVLFLFNMILLDETLPLYEAELLTNDEDALRFMAPAGLTGLWQVEKRGEGGRLSAEERKQLDIKYAKTYSLWLNIKIIFRTFTAFIQKDDV